ncbi:MAG: META domain-containing protein [Methylococcales bacterium]
MKKLVHLSLVVLMLLASACQSTSASDAGTASTAELRNTLWKLTSLNGKPVQTREGQRMASLTLASEESSARIVTACNQGSASYSVEGASIKFSVAMSTKMMCEPEPMQQQAAFFKVIADTARFAIKGETLELYDAESKLLASFHSEYLK